MPNVGTWGETVYARLLGWRPSLDLTLFGMALAVFASTRLVDLLDFPIYFFTDEAIATLQAANFVNNGFRDSLGDYFPTYFRNDAQFSDSLNVYAQIVPYLVFGYSAFATRAMAVLVAFTGMVAVGLILKDFLKIRFWWVGVLLLSITPAWFLHSRTAFSPVFAVAFYAWFLYFYMRYRYRRPSSIFPALLFGALAFYAYQPLQVIVVGTGLLLLLTDLRHHWQNRRIAGLGVLFLIVLAVPYLRFQIDHPGELEHALRLRQSYWLFDVPFTEKLEKFWREYFFGLNPAYWYDPNDSHDLIRHRMKGYGHILLPTLPFAIIGLGVCLRNIRSSAHRTVLIALVAAPAGTAMVAVAVFRELVMVVPAALLTAIGLALVLELLAKRVAYGVLAVGVFALLSVANVYMMRDALTNGPTWFNNYGLYGMQWGARQVFGEAEKSLEDSPETKVLISPIWANGANNLFQFFLHDQPRAQLGHYLPFDQSRLELNDDMLFVMPLSEYQQIVDNAKFTNVRVEKIIKYPDGTDGFFFVRFNYSPEADAIIAAEIAARRQPVQEEFSLDGQTIAVLHSRLDIGTLEALFDGDPATLVRTGEANPAVFELTFPQPRPLTGITVTTGTMDMTVTAMIFSDEGAEPLVYSQTFKNLPFDPTVDLNFDSVPRPAKKIRIEVKNVNGLEFDHVHVRELVLR